MIVYRNGNYTPDAEVGSARFRSGAGVFETLLYNGREVRLLEAHLTRLFTSLRELGLRHEEADFPSIFEEVLERNGLTGRPARMNIFYPVESPGRPAQPIVCAAPYTPDPALTFRLAVWPHAHTSPLNAHKVMNRMHLLLAERYGVSQGCNDAVMTDGRGSILETTRAALVVRRNGRLFTPRGEFLLRSTGVDAAREALTIEDADMNGPEALNLADAEDWEHIYVVNSLRGMKPVTMLNGREFEPDTETCVTATQAIKDLPQD